ncbi:ASCH domain protein [Pirellulimonas nuda]|uniref:ASCH domain protein n=1 Tax=Pirellulimonas nuda TaxID=2528009 RepID=A0A518DA76_9BACT|nr:ASCH domain-containing protein [Pirellulimonas nuda]QDU88380.1 ASCH domain protein [Pirellulimonas nuda]
MPSHGPGTIKALTIDAYWAWAIVYGQKRVENRTWQTHYRGALVIHAGRTRRRDAEAVAWLERYAPGSLATEEQVAAVRGCVLGIADLVGCRELASTDAELFPTAPDLFATGPWCWELDQVRPLAAVRVPGRLSLWDLPVGVLAAAAA